LTTLCALLCTDIVDSTKLAVALGEGAAASLWHAHDRVARDLLIPWHGREIEKTDGLLLLFDSAADAAGYAIAYHHALAALEPSLSARAGLHVAYITLRANTAADQVRGAIPIEVEGIAKPLVSRTMGTAMGGQTLMTADARLSLGVTPLKVESHGHWRFKGFADPIELFEVGDASAPFVAPPDVEKAYRVIRYGDAWQPLRQVAHKVPAERDRFVGRQEPLRALKAKFDKGSRLVSVLGIGGAGKTRLAIRYAWTWLGEFPGGVWFCDLSQARTLDGIFFEVAQALDVPLGKTEPEVQLAHAIAGRGRCLVIFDNFEQVAKLAELTVGRWLDRATQASFIVTTREVLGIAGEDTLALGPLPASEAVSLFLQLIAKQDYVSAPNDREAIEQLVEVLDGLPLAIELAAARIRVMSPRALLSRMKERFKLLWSAGGRQDRQATLRATLDWSWELLTVFERIALAQLSVFEGGIPLKGAEAVIEFADTEHAPWTVDVLQGLADKSLIRRTAEDRFDLLESVREYANEHLWTEGRFPNSGAAAAIDAQLRHCRYFVGLDTGALEKCGDVELNNLVAACRRACELNCADLSVGALTNSWRALKLRGPFRVAVQLAETIEALPGLSSGNRTEVDWVAASAQQMLGHSQIAGQRVRAGLERARAEKDRAYEARFLCLSGEQLAGEGEGAAALSAFVEADTVAEEIGDKELACRIKSSQGNLCYDLGRLDQARSYYEAGLAIAHEAGDDRWRGGLLGNLGSLTFDEGEVETAQRLFEECLALARKTGERRWEGNMRCNLGFVLHEAGKTEQARGEFEAALAMAQAMGHARLECTALCNLGIVLEAQGDPGSARSCYEKAVRLANELADRRSEGQFRGYLGLLLARTGHSEAALACLGVGEQLLADTSDALSLGLLLCRKAEAELRLGRTDAAFYAFRRVEGIAVSANAAPGSELRKALALLSKALLSPAPS